MAAGSARFGPVLLPQDSGRRVTRFSHALCRPQTRARPAVGRREACFRNLVMSGLVTQSSASAGSGPAGGKIYKVSEEMTCLYRHAKDDNTNANAATSTKLSRPAESCVTVTNMLFADVSLAARTYDLTRTALVGTLPTAGGGSVGQLGESGTRDSPKPHESWALLHGPSSSVGSASCGQGQSSQWDRAGLPWTMPSTSVIGRNSTPQTTARMSGLRGGEKDSKGREHTTCSFSEVPGRESASTTVDLETGARPRYSGTLWWPQVWIKLYLQAHGAAQWKLQHTHVGELLLTKVINNC